MAPRLKLAIAVIVALAIGTTLWWANVRADRAERQLGLDAARTLSESFVKARDLRVATLSGEVIARGDDPGFAGLLPSSMTVKYPYRVDYMLDLRRLDRDAYRWDAGTRTLTVRLPDVAATRPNVDAGRAAQVGTSGVFMSRGAALRLNATVASRAASRAADASAKLVHMNRARASAKEAMQALVRAPLRAAGLGDVTVVARFPWEAGATGDVIPWDESRPVEEIIRR